MSPGPATRSDFTAVTTKTRSPKTIGDALPRPDRGAFHLTFVFSSQVTGGSPLGAVPLASGPRHWCQFSIRCGPGSAACPVATIIQVQNVSNAVFFMGCSFRGTLTGPQPEPDVITFMLRLGMILERRAVMQDPPIIDEQHLARLQGKLDSAFRTVEESAQHVQCPQAPARKRPPDLPM